MFWRSSSSWVKWHTLEWAWLLSHWQHWRLTSCRWSLITSDRMALWSTPELVCPGTLLQHQPPSRGTPEVKTNFICNTTQPRKFTDDWAGYPEENMPGILETRSLVAIFYECRPQGLVNNCKYSNFFYRYQPCCRTLFPTSRSICCHACKTPSYFCLPWNHWKELSPALSSGETKEHRRGFKRLSAWTFSLSSAVRKVTTPCNKANIAR